MTDPGLRERKKLRTREAIVDAAFACSGARLRPRHDRGHRRRGRGHRAAHVLRATSPPRKTSSSPTSDAVDGLRARLAERPAEETAIDALRAWLARLMRRDGRDRRPGALPQAPVRGSEALAAHNRALMGRVDELLAEHIARDLGDRPDDVRPRMIASAVIGALGALDVKGTDESEARQPGRGAHHRERGAHVPPRRHGGTPARGARRLAPLVEPVEQRVGLAPLLLLDAPAGVALVRHADLGGGGQLGRVGPAVRIPQLRAHERLRAVRVDLLGASTIAVCGGLPTGVSRSSSSGSALTRAGPFTRSVVSRPGITKMTPARPVSTMFSSVSSRRLPVASGIARCSSSSTVTKPGCPPRGLTSPRPSAEDVPMNSIGAAAISRRHISSMWPMSLRTARSIGAS